MSLLNIIFIVLYYKLYNTLMYTCLLSIIRVLRYFNFDIDADIYIDSMTFNFTILYIIVGILILPIPKVKT